MKEIQGYIVISENDPSERGLLFFTPEKANEHKDHMNQLIPLYDDPSSIFWNKQHWKQKPQPFKMYSLTMKEEV